jgi:glyoxylase-like metal-dependent hydrolase (beta-lactamase superfamily II)
MLMETPQELSARCYVLGSRYFPLFWLGTQPPTLVEGGVSAVIPRVLKQMKNLSLNPPQQVILLHEHPDHVSGLPILKTRWPHMEAVATPEASRLLSQEKTVQSYKEIDRFFTKVLIEQGEGEEAGWSDFLPLVPVKPENLPSGIHIIPAQGHSPGSRALFWEKEGILFVSDALGYYSSQDKHFPSFFQSLALYLDSIRRMEDIKPAILVLGHLQYFKKEQVSQVFRRSREEALMLAENVNTQGENAETMTFKAIYQDELAIFFPEEIIRRLTRLLVKRSLES